MDIYTLIICAIFFGININIIWSDIYNRKIRNSTLLILLGILPFWFSIFPYGESINTLGQITFSLVLIILGIFFYSEKAFLGSGDIKYGAILLLFLGEYSLSILIGNIGVLTLVTLLFWWAMIIGELCVIFTKLGGIDIKSLIPAFNKTKITQSLLFIILDWIIIGFFISLLIKDISIKVFEYIPVGGDFYFLISVYVFILRPMIRYILTKWEYKIFAILGMFIYFLSHTHSHGSSLFTLEFYSYFNNIWQYILIFTLVNYITNKTFVISDTLIKDLKISNLIYTVPYSIIIFCAFCFTYFFDINLMEIIRNNSF